MGKASGACCSSTHIRDNQQYMGSQRKGAMTRDQRDWNANVLKGWKEQSQ